MNPRQTHFELTTSHWVAFMTFSPAKSILIIFHFIIFATNLHAKSTIIWPYFSYPPMFIVEGEKLSGYGIDVLDVIMKNMPEYNHKYISAAPSRIFQNLKHGKNYCAFGATRTPEREKYIHFSRPARLVISDMIIIRKADSTRLISDLKISLKTLLLNPDLIMGTTANASFGLTLDRVIQKYGTQTNIESLSGSDTNEQLIQMLVRKRIDWFIWDPVSVLMLAKKLNLSRDLIMVAIKETREFGILGYVVCPKNEWGSAVIKKVDQILRREVGTDKFYQLFTPWVPVNLRAEYKQHYQRLMID